MPAGSDPGPFLIWPDARLKARAAPVAAVDDEVRAVWARMIAAMVAMPGIGLAAPQIGVGRRLAVVDPSAAGVNPLRLANPEILWASPETVARREASPNLPGIAAEVVRPATVRVGFLDGDGRRAERILQGDWARSVQHQIDHLDGLLFVDRLGPVRRRRALEAYAKARRRRERAR